jgi:nucleoside 2-deoxyribosyltransferase
MIIYLANPYGFSKQQRNKLLPELVSKLESFGHEVWEPFERNAQIDFNCTGWPYDVGQKDKKDVENCDAIFAVCNGNPPDEGVMIELGMAIALHKKIYLFRDDFRKCSDSPDYPLNLMLFCGFYRHEWKNNYFTSIEGIKL